ncbi:TPA: DegT/DnrJ/EryC1/StrS family aminotransferase, partial [archaeon]|nr:DegT/DnrJ/EryC1/StrS family aminotransferase [Candidatus Naiadarchaeales archaeon SRR2090153.bin1042]
MSNKVELIGKKVKPKRFMPIAKPDLPSLESIKKEVKQILDTGMITNHDFVKRFENAVADYIGVKHAVCVSSGTSGLMLAAKALGLKIIPVINKIDMVNADIDQVTLEIMDILGVTESEILKTSAKNGQGVDEVLQAIVEKVPAPSGDASGPLRAMIITSIFDSHQGAIAYVRVFDGELVNQPLYLLSTHTPINPVEIGVFKPERKKRDKLAVGEVGYVSTGLKDITPLKVGDTITTVKAKSQVEQLPGYKEPKPVVFASFYPE